MPPAAPPVVQRGATPGAVPLRRPAPQHSTPQAPASAPAVQRLSADKRERPRTTPAPLPGSPPALPHPPPSRPSALPTPPVIQRSPLRPRTPPPSQAQSQPQSPNPPNPPNPPTNGPQPATPAPKPTPLQRNPLHPTPAHTTTAVSPVTAHRTPPGPTAQTQTAAAAAAATTATAKAATPTNPSAGTSDAPPEYVAIPKGQFDPRALSDFQLDELTHRLIGRITRLVRTELRLDRERIGRLRDPRH
jgi:hypothetical protein